jgi:hypothetical protein
MTTIYVIGNSHVCYFFGLIPLPDEDAHATLDDFEFRGKKCGHSGATIYGLSNKGSATGAGVTISNYIKEHSPIDELVLVLGEVDCRATLERLKSGEDYQPVLRSTIFDTYRTFLLDHVMGKCGRVFLFGSVPYHPEFPRSNPLYGRLKEISSSLDELLVELCADVGAVPFLFGRYLNDLGIGESLAPKPDDVHLGIEKTQELLLPFLKEKIHYEDERQEDTVGHQPVLESEPSEGARGADS